MRLNNQIEYIALHTIPVAAKNVTHGCVLNNPIKIKNSPIKFDVPGKLIFANVNKKKKERKKRHYLSRPPIILY